MISLILSDMLITMRPDSISISANFDVILENVPL